MEKRQLGRSGITVPTLCVGGNVFGWTIDEAQSFKVLDTFADAGLTFIDTADVYSAWVPGHQGGESEAIIGKWLKARGNRDKLIIATKVGKTMGSGTKGLAKDYIRSSVEASLERLQTDYIDLYQSHEDDPSVSLEETLGVYQKLIDEGKVRAIGASNYSGARLKEALEVNLRENLPRYESHQPLYNLYDRADYEKDLEPVVQEYGIGVIPYYGLAAGFLTGKYRSEADFNKSPRGGGMGKYLNDRGRKVLQALDEVSENHKANPAQVALAWLMARPSITAPIASATKDEQIKDLIAATTLTLTTADMDKLNAASQS